MTSIKPEIMIIYLTHSCSAGPEWSDLISPDPLRYSALVQKRFILGADISIAVMPFYAASMWVAVCLQVDILNQVRACDTVDHVILL